MSADRVKAVRFCEPKPFRNSLLPSTFLLILVFFLYLRSLGLMRRSLHWEDGMEGLSRNPWQVTVLNSLTKLASQDPPWLGTHGETWVQGIQMVCPIFATKKSLATEEGAHLGPRAFRLVATWTRWSCSRTRRGQDFRGRGRHAFDQATNSSW